MRQSGLLRSPLFVVVLICTTCFSIFAQNLQAPLSTTAGGIAVGANTGVSSPRDTSASRVIVKFRSAFAAQVEQVLPSSNIATAAEMAANPDVSGFLARHQVRSFAPLYPNVVSAKRRRQVSTDLLAQAVRSRFSARARRASGSFQLPDVSRAYVLHVDESADIEKVLSALRADPNVEYAEADKLYRINDNPNDPYLNSKGSWGQGYDDLWGIKGIGAVLAWQTATGSGIVVAVVDTGLDYNHPDMNCNVWANSGEIAGNGRDDDGNGFIDDLRGWNFVNNSNDVTDDHGHGTHVAGTIAACGNNGLGVIGVAWQAKIMPVKALNSAGMGYWSDLANAIVYAADNGADIISNSWGGYGNSQTIADAISYAYNLGVVIVAAAGNSGDDARNYSPANLPDVITVAATTPAGSLAVFSNFGPKIDVAAPGVDVLSLRAAGTAMPTPVTDGYTRASGTSMATPHVSGVAALILSQHPAYTNEQVRQVLRVSASDVGDSGFDLTYGYGAVNAAAALTVGSPLEAKIQNIQYGSTPLGPIAIWGVARGGGFARYTLEYGSGAQPSSWTLFQTGVAPSAGVLGQFNPSAVADGVYTVRLTVYDGSGFSFIDRAQLSVNTVFILSPVPPRAPSSATTFKPGKVIPIVGTAVAAEFQSFRLEWAAGSNPSSGWQTTGMTPTGGGLAPLLNVQLGTWDTSSITQAGYYSIRLSVNGRLAAQSSTVVYLEPDLVSTNWPVWIDQGPYFNSGVVPVIKADGTPRLAVASPNLGTTPGALWLFELDGTTQKSPLPSYGSFHQPSVAPLNGPGPQIIVADNNVIRVFNGDSAPSAFVPSTAVDFMRPPLVVDDLNNDSQFQTIAVGNNFANQTAEIYAWQPGGTLFSPHFPIMIADQNPLANWYNHVRLLVGDFRGDGMKEIVVQDGLSSTAYTLRMFASDGTPVAWNAPLLSGRPVAMVAADLDHNGMLETILVSYSGTQAEVHVFQSDGSERPGWPLLTPNPDQNSQAFLAVGDLDRDGQEDIVFSHESEMYVLRPNGTLFSNAWPLRTGSLGFGAVVIGDIDGDGRAEIVTTNNVFTSGYYDPKLLAIRSDGSIARSWQLTGMNGYDCHAYPTPAIGDFDQNGITDIAVAYEVTGPGGLIPGVVTLLSTGAPFHAMANDWPFLLHDVRNTGVLTPRSRTTSTLAADASTSVSGQPVTLMASVARVSPGNPAPTGAMRFYDGANTLGTCSLDTVAQCALQVSNLSVGYHSLTVRYAGDSTFAASNSPVLQHTVNKAGTTTTAVSRPNPAVTGQAVNLSATILVRSPGAGIPTGQVVFYENLSSIGTGTLDASGQARLETSNLPAGSHNLTAEFQGDGNFEKSSSAAIVQLVNNAAITVGGSEAQIVNAGQRATYTITVTPKPAPYNFAVTFNCSALPAYATCEFSPSSVTPGDNPAQVNLAIGTTARTTAWNRRANPSLFATSFGVLGIGLVWWGVPGKRRSRFAITLLLMILCVAAVSCGGGNSASQPPPVSVGTPAGSYTIGVNASGAGETYSTTVSLTVR